MKAIDLNGLWQMCVLGESETLPANVPGTVAEAMLAAEKIPDPYWRDNETKVLPVFDKDYVFSRAFHVEAELLAHDRVYLRCDGLDTLAEITLNGERLAETDNMHRMYRFDVKGRLRAGENTLSVLFRSPTAGLEGSGMGSFPTGLRKAACMYGWDWGLSLPDSGIWRDISIEAFNGARLDWISIVQDHTPGRVTLDIAPEAEVWDENVMLRGEVLDPEGNLIGAGNGAFQVKLENPRLWQPVGFGEQPLYTVRITAQKDGRALDALEKHIGLRTVELDRSRQPDGCCDYSFKINGRPVYIRGQAMVIEDAFLGRSTPERWKRLVDNALRSNLNCIRVWGGAYYPPELFFELCDRAGVLVYMDFMFACRPYPADDAFCENIRMEAEQQVKMMASHPSLLVLCGNNEIGLVQQCMTDPNDPIGKALMGTFGSLSGALTDKMVQVLTDNYDRLFRQLLKETSIEYAPQIPYVSSSPSLPEGVEGSIKDMITNGDMHFYLQYVGNLPYQVMAKIPARMLSEVGFQSYPSMKTIKEFCVQEDMRPDSPVMYAHQKCKNGNETIEEYMGRDYTVPEDFGDYVYLSQLMAAEIMKFTAETYRRQSAFNRGTIVWQYNDCWPVVSWSGVDYFGRWKALQYFIKRFFAPVLLSAKVEDSRAELWLSNQSGKGFSGKVLWKLRDNLGMVAKAGEKPLTVPVGESILAYSLNFAEDLKNHRDGSYLEYTLHDKYDVPLSSETALFCLPKEYHFEPVNISLEVSGQEITVTADRYAKAVMLDTVRGDCLFSDNWFDLSAGESKQITVVQGDVMGKENLEVKALNMVM